MTTISIPMTKSSLVNRLDTEDLITELQRRLPNCKITIEAPQKTITCEAQSQPHMIPEPHITYTFAGQANPPFGFGTKNATKENVNKS